MRRAACLTFLVVAACLPPQPMPTTPASTPPPPVRPENVVTAFGVVRDPANAPLANARVRGWEADGHCDAVGGPVTRLSGPDGTYEITVGRRVGPAFEGCIVLEFAAGGSVALVQQNARFASGAEAARLPLNVVLPPARLLTRAEADRLIEVVRHAMHEGWQAAIEELALYTQEDYTEHRRQLRGIAGVQLLSEGDRRFEYELTGTRPGTSVRVTIEQDALTRISFS